MTDAAPPELDPLSPPPPARADLAPLVVLLAAACVIGVGPILVRLSDAGPTATGFWRLAFALPVLALLSARDRSGPNWPNRAVIVAGVMFAFDLGFWHTGIHLTTVANATVLSNLTPIVVMAAAWIVFKERPRPLFAAAVVVAIAGAAMMALSKGGGFAGGSHLVGDLISTTTALWYAFYFLAVTVARRTIGTSRLMFWSGLVGLPILMVAAALLGEPLWPKTAVGWWACAGLGVMHIVGQGSIAWALGRLPTATASVTVLIQPVVAALLGWRLFGEAMTPFQMLGGALALAGVVAAQLAGAQAPRVRPPAGQCIAPNR